jgi:hypothetical protein
MATSNEIAKEHNNNEFYKLITAITILIVRAHKIMAYFLRVSPYLMARTYWVVTLYLISPY